MSTGPEAAKTQLIRTPFFQKTGRYSDDQESVFLGIGVSVEGGPPDESGDVLGDGWN